MQKSEQILRTLFPNRYVCNDTPCSSYVVIETLSLSDIIGLNFHLSEIKTILVETNGNTGKLIVNITC